MDIGIIGGADGPTQVYVSASPASPVWLLLLLAAAAAGALLFAIWKKKRKR